MEGNRNNEMEQIQRGLEAFLEKEINYTDPEDARRNDPGRAGGDPEEEQFSEAGQTQDMFEEAFEEQGWNYADEEAYGEEEEAYEDWDAPRRRPVREQSRARYDANSRRPSSRRAYDDIPIRETPRWEEEEEDRGRRRSGKEVPPVRKKRATEAGQEDSDMAYKKPNAQKARKKKRKKKHRLLKLLIAVAVIFVILGVGMYKLVGTVYGKMTYREIASVAGAPLQENGVVNILLIGNDSRENGEDGRSDAMILLSISRKTKKIYMTSLLRDMYVDIPGHDGNRLNAAYSFGGAELLMETIEKNFDISVNRYILVNFEAFAGLVDAVDGIELELTTEEIEYINGYLVEYNVLTDRPQGTDNMDTSVSGLVHLNGPQALAYSRNRYLGTDFGRTDRQRKVLTAVIKKLPSAMLNNAGGLMDGLLPNLTTNLTQNECFRLSLMAGKLLTYDIESDSIPQPGTYTDVTIRKMAVLEVDFETNIRYLKEKLYGEQGD